MLTIGRALKCIPFITSENFFGQAQRNDAATLRRAMLAHILVKHIANSM
jgi:hypothetical protein